MSMPYVTEKTTAIVPFLRAELACISVSNTFAKTIAEDKLLAGVGINTARKNAAIPGRMSKGTGIIFEAYIVFIVKEKR